MSYRIGLRSDAAKEHQYDYDDQDSAQHANTGVTEAIAIASEAPAESAQKEDDKDNCKDRTE